MIYDHEFNCPDGHTFRANAKLRARCPECGKMARRTYSASTESVGVVDGPSASTTPTPKVDDGKLKLIRRGKPRSIMPVKKTTPPKDAHGRFVKASKTTSKPKSKTPVKKPTQLVTRKTVSAGTKKKPAMPKVTRRPPRTAVARHVSDSGGRKSYADEMIETYGFRR